MGENLLTAAEVAAQLRKSTDMLKLWRHKKTGPPYIKVGRSVRYRQSAVEKWLNSQTQAAA